ncbi:MAG TPA: alpha/beta fold hydrolase, partial [Rugosimonospora sp.]|nr:alpha/beta fold hydrolase [Rugosimonospora sp.]
AGYYGDGAFDPPRTREQLAACAAPVLVVAGERDPAPGPEHAAELAKVFPDGRIVVLREAGHYPWVTHAELFVDTLREFLD